MTTKAYPAAEEALHDAGLRYVSCQSKGYQRIRTAKKGFIYLDKKGDTISNPQLLSRIHSLVIPPAWQQVWICPTANGHIQATGLDARGRKQYRYHPSWNKLRNKDKFSNLQLFGKKLPILEKRIKRDLRSKKITRELVCALALSIMGKTYFRIGNKTYEKENKSYGLTTLLNHHLRQLHQNKVFFRFIGKKGVVQQSFLHEKSLIRLLNKVKEIPGQRLFQYYDEQQQQKELDSGELNEYLKEATDAALTCKIFRTWYACILTLHYLSSLSRCTTDKERKQALASVIDKVAGQLGNTRTVTRTHYIHPLIIESYLLGKLDRWLSLIQHKGTSNPENPLYKRKLMAILKSRT